MKFKKLLASSLLKEHIVKRRTIIIVLLSTIIIASPIMLYFYKQHSLVQPEELHLNGDGVYFNIFTEDSRGEFSPPYILYSILLKIIFLCKFAISRTATTSCLLLCQALPDHAVVLLTDTFVPLSYATVAPDPSISGS